MIRINSVIIKAALLLLPLAAPAEPGFRMDFSGQLPGQAPEGWASVWQKPVDDVIYVTNAGDPANPEKRQLLIDRAHGEDHTYYRYQRRFRLADMGAAPSGPGFIPLQGRVREPVRCAVRTRIGPANRADHDAFVLPAQLGTERLSVPGHAAQLDGELGGEANLGEFRRNAWHRIELLLPYGENSPMRSGFGRLYDASGRPGPVFEVPALLPMSAESAVSIVPANKRKGAAIYLADFVFEPASPRRLK